MSIFTVIFILSGLGLTITIGLMVAIMRDWRSRSGS